jgi:hypothetical protein
VTDINKILVEYLIDKLFDFRGDRLPVEVESAVVCIG